MRTRRDQSGRWNIRLSPISGHPSAIRPFRLRVYSGGFGSRNNVRLVDVPSVPCSEGPGVGAQYLGNNSPKIWVAASASAARSAVKFERGQQHWQMKSASCSIASVLDFLAIIPPDSKIGSASFHRNAVRRVPRGRSDAAGSDPRSSWRFIPGLGRSAGQGRGIELVDAGGNGRAAPADLMHSQWAEAWASMVTTAFGQPPQMAQRAIFSPPTFTAQPRRTSMSGK